MVQDSFVDNIWRNTRQMRWDRTRSNESRTLFGKKQWVLVQSSEEKQRDEGKGTAPTPFWVKCMRNKANFWMNGRNTSDVHTPAWQMVDFLGRDFVFWRNYNLVVKLNTSCVQNVVAIERGRLGRARPGTDAEDSFFPGAGHTYPHLDEIHGLKGF